MIQLIVTSMVFLCVALIVFFCSISTDDRIEPFQLKLNPSL
jgi:hypothetical protein